MTSTIKVNTITTESGSTLTVGGCGKTVALASGASQTGFGRTGTVDWNTTKKTTDFTATNGDGFFVDTSGGSNITVTLPSSPSAGNIVAIADYAGTAATNKIIIARNGSNIQGVAVDVEITTNREARTLVYVDATQGWVAVNNNEDSIISPAFVTATGGTITTVCTNFKVHTFTGPGTFCVSCAGNSSGSNTVDYLVIAGGASGGSGGGGGYGRGGGGSGGYRFSNGTASGCYSAGPSPLGASALPVTATGFPITVGGGGAGGPDGCSHTAGNPGAVSTFSTITSAGGGGGGGQTAPTPALAGGSGGGGAAYCEAGAAGNTPSVSPPQGNPGGLTGPSGAPNSKGAGGGGGAGAAGGVSGPGTSPTGGSNAGGGGGNGLASTINGTPTTRAGGGGGGGNATPGAGAAGGTGGGGTGGGYNAGGAEVAASATVNTGSGGGGGGYKGSNSNSSSGSGGSGIVIIRYKFQ